MKERKKYNSCRNLAACFIGMMLFIYGCSIHGGCVTARADEHGAAVEEPQNLYALAACLMDAESGRVLYEKNGSEHRANASTTKILTLILTLERGNPDDVVTVSERAARQPEVKLGMHTGEQYRLGDLCYSLMLESHNDSAVAIAEHVGGSVEGFAALMNEKAQELGCGQTHFITPNGLDESDETDFHGTSAIDLAKIMSYCILRSPMRGEFLNITRTQDYKFTDVSGKRQYACCNHNAFLHMMDGVISGKTGFTADAGYCYVGALERDGRTFVVTLLGCGWPNNKTYKWKDCQKLFAYGIDNYEYRTLNRENGVWSRPVANGASGDGNPYETPLVCLREEPHEPITMLLRSDETLTFEERIKDLSAAPILKGENAGEVCYYLERCDGTRELVYCAGVYAADEIRAKNMMFYLRFVIQKWVA